MKVRHKTFLVVIICIFPLALSSIILLRTFFMNYIDQTEKTVVMQDLHRAMSIIQQEESALESTVMDWAYWDDTFRFLNNHNSEYVDVNLLDNTLSSLRLNYMGFYNLKGELMFAKTYRIQTINESSFQEELLQSLKNWENYKSLMSSPTPITGLLMISGQPMFISISPVTPSDNKSPGNGFIVFCKLIDQKYIDYFVQVLGVDFKFKAADDPEILESLKIDYQKISINNTVLYIQKTTNSIKGYAFVNNIYNDSQIIMEFDAQRPIYSAGLTIIKYTNLAFIAMFLIIISLSLLGLEFLLIRRLEKLNVFMNSVRNKKKMSEMISLPGNDEITNLAESVNNMLKELDSYYKEIKTNEERFKLIMEATNDGYFDFYLLTNKYYISPYWLTYLGFEHRNYYFNYDQILKTVHSEDRNQFRIAFNDCLMGNTEMLYVEYRTRKKSGDWVWIQVRGKIVEYDKFDNPVRLIGTISDLTQRKNYEAENLYLSQTDLVTTLKNRTFAEALLEKADKYLVCDPWIILGDVNGLKLINDTFGHQEGDRLLRAIGEILKKCCSTDAIPARWGGDEFIIFIDDKPADYVDKLIRDIKEECDTMTGYQTPISISWGRAHKDRLHTDMKSVIKLAEERMYRNKLLESRSAKSSILSSLEQSLHEKHIETEEHTRRITKICVQIGIRMGLTQEELDEVALLSMLHDIGKIGIPEAILLKPGKLTADEWEIMKTHSEIGYRIAVSTADLAHVANEILSHHERFDGTGYPQGLKGKEIPKLSRLLAIVDSYDVMTHSRHYKEAMSVDSAIKEVQRCSGQQFDPEMVEQFLTILREDNITSE